MRKNSIFSSHLIDARIACAYPTTGSVQSQQPLCVLGAPAVDHATGLVVALSFAPSPPAAAHDIGTGVLLLHVQPPVANWALPNAQHTLAAPLFPSETGGSWACLRAFAAHRLVSVPVLDYAAVLGSNNPCLSAAWLCARPHQGMGGVGRLLCVS